MPEIYRLVYSAYSCEPVLSFGGHEVLSTLFHLTASCRVIFTRSSAIAERSDVNLAGILEGRRVNPEGSVGTRFPSPPDLRP